VAGSQGTGLTGVLTGLTGLARNSSRSESISPNSKVVKKKPNFAELLYKYQRIAEQKQNNRLGEQRWIFITESKEASMVITLVFIIYTIDACAMDCIFRYK
jgi:hypothetical protein